jgi:hypothetical protein
MPTFARHIENRLAAVHQRNDGQRPQSLVAESEGKAPNCEAGDTEDEIAKSQDDAGDCEVTNPLDIGDRRHPHIVRC